MSASNDMDSSAGVFDGGARRLLWTSWLIGAAALAALVAVVLHRAEAEAFARLIERAEPGWFVLALALQALTYLAQGQLYRRVARAGQVRLPLLDACRLGLMKLFVDQALPTYGVSGTLAVTAAFQRLAVPHPVAMACLVVSLSSYLLAYVLALAVALAIVVVEGHATPLLILAGGLFVFGSLVAGLGVALLAGRGLPGRLRRLAGFARVERGLALLGQADTRLTRNPRLLALTVALDLGIVLLDAGTLWALLRSLGTEASWSGVFAGFMLASVLRSLGITPGGLGVFEAAAVTTLGWAGVPLPAALSATLLFRGLSFWLPMLPGLLIARSALRTPRARQPVAPGEPWWSWTPAQAFAALDCAAEGLSGAAAAARTGAGETPERARPRGLARIFLEQLRSPLVLILIFASIVSLVVHDWLDAAIVLAIVLIGALLGAGQEYRASSALERLRRRVAITARVHRDGAPVEIPAGEVVPGDVIELSAGSLIPADGLVLAARDCFVGQGLLTGETFPVEKRPGLAEPGASLAERDNCLFMGSSLRSGTATLLAVRTGADSEYGRIARSLSLRPPETEFERGLRHFGALLLKVMLLMVVGVLAANILLERPTVETLMFAIALAVGLSPELLPAILGITLARGAQRMARRGVIVRRPNAIENLGAMDVLCTDKTGTLTRGVVQLDGALDPDGQPSERCLLLAGLNASLQTGLANALDAALVAGVRERGLDLGAFGKLDEIPYDFVRKRLAVVVEGADGEALMIVKGALDKVLERCTRIGEAEAAPLDEAALAALRERYAQWSAQGYRVLGLASRPVPRQARYTESDENELAFVGFLLFFDPPEPGVRDTLRDLDRLGVAVKIISGDNRLVTRHVAEAVGIPAGRVITGGEMLRMRDEELLNLAPQVALFAEVDPNQKERIILALQKTGHVVGFLGDGINDAPALHAADVGVSVEQAVDVAKEAADFVLLRHDLDLLRQGIDEGRHTFANTLKYIFITTSANFGNMISMALASLFLPFLPLLAKQILLNNFLSDIPAMGIAGDNVDREWERTPHHWNLREVRNFMVVFGLVSSAFDLLTFGTLFYFVGERPELFRTGWFVESLLTELAIVFVVRTYKPFYRSRPGRLLLSSTLAVMLLTLLLPYTPAGAWFDLVPLPPALLAMIGLITLLYAATSEAVKRRFYAAARMPRGAARRYRGVEPGR
ncbi:cation-translocating P-type ATPase [Azotobacter vinelandii CA]|uniref:Magnesium-transporting ATPase, P-type 1 n=2 Tax=Azotobacter vinelandii TaxID=354 RepID=C1DHA2_AZOVD|nr:magnesium-translocating P-type ATPase [Azotobacter vinelandii]ACO76509.1 cation-translocating P-type ATPase with extended N-terminal transmembrane region [Azotobacter vinelandii DJ]AGK12866.1 cation-translocating P-type ATPase [Azotobacter vinelandii CA]AGK19178.1 cation-translocating P-type ATPase [Azotobacter vinelandii CA6]SFX09640.1 Mg2+-importing ATPase [Azotobacter vinelandii]GLK58694.1 hypothetical protein GCM10017624_08510 [Azotobacter vinelandii]